MRASLSNRVAKGKHMNSDSKRVQLTVYEPTEPTLYAVPVRMLSSPAFSATATKTCISYVTS